eukprot:augustus_masked-scaffold_13-processed-gene-1.5-mRNA-1 protein AED:1.00 eAED:1.00 QI:0/-1/0/0/-1/1/1/0/399
MYKEQRFHHEGPRYSSNRGDHHHGENQREGRFKNEVPRRDYANGRTKNQPAQEYPRSRDEGRQEYTRDRFMPTNKSHRNFDNDYSRGSNPRYSAPGRSRYETQGYTTERQRAHESRDQVYTNRQIPQGAPYSRHSERDYTGRRPYGEETPHGTQHRSDYYVSEGPMSSSVHGKRRRYGGAEGSPSKTFRANNYASGQNYARGQGRAAHEPEYNYSRGSHNFSARPRFSNQRNSFQYQSSRYGQGGLSQEYFRGEVPETLPEPKRRQGYEGYDINASFHKKFCNKFIKSRDECTRKACQFYPCYLKKSPALFDCAMQKKEGNCTRPKCGFYPCCYDKEKNADAIKQNEEYERRQEERQGRNDFDRNRSGENSKSDGFRDEENYLNDRSSSRTRSRDSRQE